MEGAGGIVSCMYLCAPIREQTNHGLKIVKNGTELAQFFLLISP